MPRWRRVGAPSLWDSGRFLSIPHPTLKRGANEHCAYGARLRGLGIGQAGCGKLRLRRLVAAAGVSLATAVCAIESRCRPWGGDYQRQNACRDQHRFDGYGDHWNPRGVPSLVVAPVRAAATDCRHDWWRKNHRNEGQGKKQVNHEGNSLMLAAAHSCKTVSLTGQ